MCGINGFNFSDVKVLKKMNDALIHRGPDSEGKFVDGNTSLGHRRLSIIDLSKNGNQPMIYSHGKKKAIIVFNGEIYNFLEIRHELEEKGYRFRSNCDTEVILASYLEWGKDCVKKFNGMWAFAIYDLEKNILFLSRDRLGVKPLYYFYDGKKFIFSSEIKGILKHKLKLKINLMAIDFYFSLGFIPSPLSIYENISKLEARQNLIFDLKMARMKKEYYFNYPKYSPIYDKKKLISETEKLLYDATKIRLVSDVPLGAFLSGGIDSSVVVHEMTKDIPKEKLNTFSIGFEGNYDESKYIRVVKNIFKTKHHHKYFYEKDFNENLKNIFYFYDEPFCDPSMFPSMDLSKFARNELTVSLSGDGGDEFFGGYPRHQMAAQMEFLYKIPRIIRKLAIPFSFGRLKEGIKLSLVKKENIYSDVRQEIYKPEVYKKFAKEKMEECLKLSNGSLVEAMILMDRYFLTLPDNYLTKVDRASMANSLEVRSPLLDYRFIELSSRIPTKWKVTEIKNKILLRKIAEKFLPKEITNRKKTGFTPPIEKWINEKKYSNQIVEGIEYLYSRRMISGEWKKFYENYVLKNDNVVANNYKLRMFFFLKWYEKWFS